MGGIPQVRRAAHRAQRERMRNHRVVLPPPPRRQAAARVPAGTVPDVQAPHPGSGPRRRTLLLAFREAEPGLLPRHDQADPRRARLRLLPRRTERRRHRRRPRAGRTLLPRHDGDGPGGVHRRRRRGHAVPLDAEHRGRRAALARGLVLLRGVQRQRHRPARAHQRHRPELSEGARVLSLQPPGGGRRAAVPWERRKPGARGALPGPGRHRRDRARAADGRVVHSPLLPLRPAPDDGRGHLGPAAVGRGRGSHLYRGVRGLRCLGRIRPAGGAHRRGRGDLRGELPAFEQGLHVDVGGRARFSSSPRRTASPSRPGAARGTAIPVSPPSKGGKSSTFGPRRRSRTRARACPASPCRSQTSSWMRRRERA